MHILTMYCICIAYVDKYQFYMDILTMYCLYIVYVHKYQSTCIFLLCNLHARKHVNIEVLVDVCACVFAEGDLCIYILKCFMCSY